MEEAFGSLSDFNPLSPHGERPPRRVPAGHHANFNPLSPHGERHAHGDFELLYLLFQSTLPAWGETWPVHCFPYSTAFQSTLPAWGETVAIHSERTGLSISIHSPRMGRDQDRFALMQRREISIHSPRMGRDNSSPVFRSFPTEFQSTLPAWGETDSASVSVTRKIISIHSPRMGRDRSQRLGNPLDDRISIHSPRMGRDPLPAFIRFPCGDFNPLSPHGERPDLARSKDWKD